MSKWVKTFWWCRAMACVYLNGQNKIEENKPIYSTRKWLTCCIQIPKQR